VQLIPFQSSRIIALVLSLTLAGCASLPQPEREQERERLGLKLAPAALGQAISLQQHLTVERNGRIDELDAALDIDGERLELVGLAFGQRVLSLRYDGKQLTEWRHKMLPSQVQAEDVLEDLQLTLWPVDAIAQALPAGWRIVDQGLLRTLYRDRQVVATISYSEATRWNGTAVLDNVRYQYRLTIQAAP
jgi:hypothetical protein